MNRRQQFKKGLGFGGRGRRILAEKQRRATLRSNLAFNRRLLNIENKFKDHMLAVTNISSTDWTGGEIDPATPILCLNGVALGNGESERVGRKISINSLSVRGYLRFTQAEALTTATNGQIAKVAIVWDNQTNATQLSAEQVYNDDINGFRNLDYTTRFTVLKEKVFSFRPSVFFDGTDGSRNGLIRPFEWFINFKTPVVVTFIGDDQNVTSISDNSFHLIACTSNADTINIRYRSRIRYTDI